MENRILNIENNSGENKKNSLIILTGPTAVGKTELSIRLAKAVGGEIISADSMQVYRRMNIGTAKIMPEEMDGVPHHLIDILEPTESFNAYLFKEYATRAVSDIISRGRIPVIVGGTGFYIQTVLYDIDFSQDDGDTRIRDELTAIYDGHGAEYLHDMLKEVDPVYASEVHHNNVKKVIRAIEFYRQTGCRLSEHNEEQHKKTSPYNFAYFVLNDERSVLYERIDRRIDRMIEDGLVDEVRGLVGEGLDRNLVSMQGLGYKEIIAYLEGEMTLDEAIYTIKRDTRHFAKRQLTWFKREKETVFVNLNEVGSRDAAFEFMINYVKEKEII